MIALVRPGSRTPVPLVGLGPLDQLRAGRLRRRLPQLYVGLVLYGVSLAMMVRGHLGLAPWDVLHIALTHYLPLSLGQVLVVVSFLVLLLWIPLRETPGLGTVSNAIVVGVSTDATLAVLDAPQSGVARVTLTVGGVVLCGFASALYIGAQLGRGPRDGLMTGLARRTGLSLRLVRTGLELAVLVLGLTLLAANGGTDALGALGLGTALYALSIGPLTQLMLPACTVRLGAPVDGSARLRTLGAP
jgi:uncharacterized membrane protein YczE